MLQPQRMDRVLIVGVKDVMEPTINALHDTNILHIEDYVEEESYFQIGKPLKSVTTLSERLLKLRSIMSYLGTKDKELSKEKRAQVLADIDASLASLEAEVTQKSIEKGALESELKELVHKEDLLKPYEALGLPLDYLSGYESVTPFVGTAPADIDVKALTPDFEYFSAPYGKGKIIAVFVPEAAAAKVQDALMKGDFVEVEQLREKGEAATIKSNIAAKKADIEAKLAAVNKDMATLNDKFSQFLLSSQELLTVDTQKAEAPLKFATSDNTFVIDGWVPKKDVSALKEKLAKATGDRVYVTVAEPEHKAYAGETGAKHAEHHEVNAPVKYNNPKWAYPAQGFIDLYSRPKYDEIDPTMLFFVTFPLFYGFILGDIGYGLLLLIAGIGLRYYLRKSDGWKILTTTLIYCSLASIFFGFLFGEFMGLNMVKDGFLGFKLDWLYPHELHLGSGMGFTLPFERMMAGEVEHGVVVIGVRDLMIYTCFIGIIHILLGYAIGFRNELKQHGLKTAILHKGSWPFILIGGTILVLYVLPLMIAGDLGAISLTNPLMLVGGVLALIGLALLLVGEGAMGILEIPTLMSNVLSYTRLLAVGLSSVGIAFAVNYMAGMLWDAGILGIIGAIFVLVLGHGINLVLGIIAPGLHALRLHYVEFFMKFYKGGGKVYDPFGYVRKYTEE